MCVVVTNDCFTKTHLQDLLVKPLRDLGEPLTKIGRNKTVNHATSGILVIQEH